MRIVLQRVQSSAVEVDLQSRGTIQGGLLLLVGIGKNDSIETIRRAAQKIVNLRIFSDEDGRFQKSLLEIDGGLLLVPNFTLYADTTKGRRPEFFNAMPPAQAAELFDSLANVFQDLGIHKVERGVFGAHMRVSLVNDGPVTMVLDFED